MHLFLSLLYSSFLATVIGQTVNRVRIVDAESYIVEHLQKTIDICEKSYWNNLQVHDVTLQINETVLNETIEGTVVFQNGFVVSMQHINLIPHTILQRWLYTSATNTTNLSLEGTLSMSDVTIGYRVDGMINGERYNNTGSMLYTNIQFRTLLIKNLYTDEISSEVLPDGLRATSQMNFLPEDKYAAVLSQLFNSDSFSPSAESWANEFARIILNLALTEHPIPPFCYDCLA